MTLRRLVLSMVLAAASLAWAVAAPAAQDPRTIALRDQRGTAFDLADLHGRPALVTFVATRCTDACPIANAIFSQLDRKLQAARLHATLVTITLDPEYDSPFVMSQFARRLGAEPQRWRLASGTPADVHRLMSAFGITTHADAHGIPDVHSTFVYLLDVHGRLSRTMLLSSTLIDEALKTLRNKGLGAA